MKKIIKLFIYMATLGDYLECMSRRVSYAESRIIHIISIMPDGFDIQRQCDVTIKELTKRVEALSNYISKIGYFNGNINNISFQWCRDVKNYMCIEYSEIKNTLSMVENRVKLHHDMK